jgi:hypothetical protein
MTGWEAEVEIEEQRDEIPRSRKGRRICKTLTNDVRKFRRAECKTARLQDITIASLCQGFD